MRIVIAPDKFGGTLTAAEAAAAMAAGWRAVRPTDQLVLSPQADGGEGTVETLAAALGLTPRIARVRDPLGRPVDAAWLLLADGTAVVETATASGLARLDLGERDPRVTTTAGIGDLIRAALDADADQLVLGLGGSATNDGGAGCLAALGARIVDARGIELAPGGAALVDAARLDLTGLDPRLHDASVVLASDVDNPLLGPAGATAVYGPQKGAGPAVVAELEAAMSQWAALLSEHAPGVADRPGAGAAGGLGAGLLAATAAALRPGFDVVAELLGLAAELATADLVVTGEGRFDEQSLRGKAPAGVARLAQAAGIPCFVIAGEVAVGRRELAAAGFDGAYAVVDDAPDESTARADAARWLAVTTNRVARQWSDT